MPNPAPNTGSELKTNPAPVRGSETLSLVITGVLTIVVTITLTVLAMTFGGFAAPQSVSTGETRLTVPVMLHLATVVPALLLGPFILWREKGDAVHKILGRIWAMLMVISAIASAFIVAPGGGIAGSGFSPIHFFTVWTLINVPVAIYLARKGKIRHHRGAMTGLYVGLCIAGAFTLLPGRLLNTFFFG